MEPFVSVVMPAYNIMQLLELNLISLYKQTYPSDRYEVIVIDDGSTDGTLDMCKSLKTPYQLKVLNTGQNSGRAYSRNLGATAAEGEIIIFCDGDTLQPPKYIENHVKYHNLTDNLVLGSLPLYFALCFTHYYADFPDWQKEVFFDFVPELKCQCIDKKLVRVLKPEALLDNFENARRLSYFPRWYDDYFNIINHFAAFSATPTSWFCFNTRNVSVRKKLFLESGGFDKNFKDFGFEDWELGYRLKATGACCDCQKDVVNFHQEHPFDTSTREISNRKNFIYFCTKYNTTDLYLFAQHLYDKRCNLYYYNKLAGQYISLRDNAEYKCAILLFEFLCAKRFYNDFLNKKIYLEFVPDMLNTKKILEKLANSNEEFVDIFKELLNAHQSEFKTRKPRKRSLKRFRKTKPDHEVK